MYTPKAFVRHPEYPVFYVGEADMNTLAASTREQLLADQMSDATNGETHEPNHQFETYGYPRGDNHWASCIQVVDPIDQKAVLETIELEQNEAVLSMAVCPFISQDDEAFLVVGTGQDMKVLPKSYKAGFLHIYRFKKDTEGRSLEFVHKTPIEQPPYALLPFQGRLLAGIGTMLRIYDLGMKQLLRKSQHAKVVPTCIVGLQTQGQRIVVSDVSDGISYVAYRHEDNKFLPFCDDSVKRWTTCSTMLDYETTAGGDKFGNVWIVRCPAKVSQAADEDNGVQLLHEKGYLLGSPNRLELMVHFYVQDIPMSIQRTSLVPGGRELLLWAGLQGTLGIFVPFVSRDDVDFFQKLEQELRQVDPPLAGRDHLMYRGYYVPVKGVIDGDLVERYLGLKRDVKERIAEELDRTVREVERRIQDMRTRVAF